ncbi:hypothetical protein [Actinoplanes rectilineatus]|uniref:hypothetical protein n=1 Tax=Actinoplanes rectilineatus TaxID=113571 RepID=UPI0005F2FBD7|nr:hypothetical protein [Actinoplanes rectilineatus]
MTGAQLLARAADKLDALLADATDGPWWSDESDQYWQLHGVHGYLPGPLPGMPDQIVNTQILKAPKTGDRFEPYWPGHADGQLITAMANPLVGRALATAFRAHTDNPPADLVDVARAILGDES